MIVSITVLSLSSCIIPPDYNASTICSDVEVEMLDSIEAGNVNTLITYFKNGGDPMFECYDNSRMIPGTFRLVDRITSPNATVELIQVYLAQGITTAHKDDLLTYFIGEDPKIIQLLVDSNARTIRITQNCIPIDTLRHNSLEQYGYNYDYVYPQKGTTDFIEYCGCPCPKGSDEIIETLKYLIRKGANPHRRDASGKTAKDHAVHPAIKAYLNSL